MSVVTEAEGFYANAKAELIKLEGALPSALAMAKKLDSTPIGAAAVKVVEAALPPDAVTIVTELVDRLISLYVPSQPQQSAPPVQAA